MSGAGNDDGGKADACNPAAGDSLAHLSHELRTPLGAIAVLAEILRDERLGPLGNPRYRIYAGDIHDSAVHAGCVVAALVEASGTGTAQAPLVFVELDLAHLVRSTVSAMAALAETSGITLSAHLPGSLPHLIADRRAVRQVLDNLIANALKFTPPGGEVRVCVDYAVGGPVRIAITDNGDGMSPAELARARGEGPGPEALRRRSGGTGLGLPLVRSLAAACAAALDIQSALGQGTRVTLTFGHDRVVPV